MDAVEGKQTQRNEEMELLKRETKLNPTIDYGEPLYTLSREGIGFFPKGDIQAIKAPQKNGKTFLISMLIGAYMKGEYNGIKCEIPTPKVIYIDTEQHPRNTCKLYRRSCLIGGMDNWNYHDERFQCYHLRGKRPEQIADFVEYIGRTETPDVIFIDGVVDMVHDFNNLEESGECVRRLMDLSKVLDCAIPCVLHVNPNSDKMRGHLGTILSQKASDVISCIKEKEKSGNVTFNVEQTDTRNKDIRQFAFVIEDYKDGHGDFIAVPVPPHISVKCKTDSDEIMAQALDREFLRYNELVEAIRAIDSKMSERTAKRRITDASNAGIIAKDPYTGKYRYVGLDLENEPGLPF